MNSYDASSDIWYIYMLHLIHPVPQMIGHDGMSKCWNKDNRQNGRVKKCTPTDYRPVLSFLQRCIFIAPVRSHEEWRALMQSPLPAARAAEAAAAADTCWSVAVTVE